MNKERYYVKDSSDGQEYCISGEKHFFLIEVTDDVIPKRTIKKAIERKIFEKGDNQGLTDLIKRLNL